MRDERRIADIGIGRRFRKDLGDLKTLAESIREIGLLHPVVVDTDGRLVAGARRIEACKLLGMTSVPVHEVNLEKIARGEHDEDIVRKDFTWTER